MNRELESPISIDDDDDDDTPMLDLPPLTDSERKHLYTVLQRAEELQRHDEWRKVKLRTSSSINLATHNISHSVKDGKDASVCSTCGSSLIWLINPAKICDRCQQSTCRSCTQLFENGNRQFCSFCALDLKYRLESGEWFLAKRKKADRAQKFATEELRDALSISMEKGDYRKQGACQSPSSPVVRRIRNSPSPNSAVPSIVINDGKHDKREQGEKLRHKANNKLHLKLLEREHDSSRSSDFSDDSSYLGSSISASQESLVSLYSLADENFTLPAEMATGDVQLSLEYDKRKNKLLVMVRQCRNLLPFAKTKRSSDPFVKMYLLPDKTRLAKRKTSAKKNTLNPVYNESFKYQVESGEVHTRSLWVTVWHCIRLGHNVFLGEVNIPLSDIDLTDPAPQWFSLHEKREIDIPSPHLIYKGDLSMAVKHVPTNNILIVNETQIDSKGELHVWIKDAKNLIPTHSNGYSNPFAKIVLLPDKSKKGKRKTEIIRKTLCPSWNSVHRFDHVSASELSERSLEITVWDHSRIRGNEFLGGVRLNLGKGQYNEQEAKWMNASGYELTLWRSVIQRPNTWVEGCLTLRAHMD